VEYPDYLLADRGLSLSDNSPIAPGETRDVAVTIQDARWDTERLSGLAYDVDSSFAGVLFFFTPRGARYPMEVSGAVIPTFMPVAYREPLGEPPTPVPGPEPTPPTPTQQ
jgi:methane/ammonia monooxygenase subunit B